MEHLNPIAAIMGAYIEQVVAVSATIPPAILVLILIGLVVVGVLSGSVMTALIATVLALLGFSVLLVPTSATSLLGVGAGLAALLVSIAGASQRRRWKLVRQELAELKAQVGGLEALETRRFMADLKSGSAPDSPGSM
jgi:energy-coupling factor transporter transmembrane protein EcfT